MMGEGLGILNRGRADVIHFYIDFEGRGGGNFELIV